MNRKKPNDPSPYAIGGMGGARNYETLPALNLLEVFYDARQSKISTKNKH